MNKEIHFINLIPLQLGLTSFRNHFFSLLSRMRFTICSCDDSYNTEECYLGFRVCVISAGFESIVLVLWNTHIISLWRQIFYIKRLSQSHVFAQALIEFYAKEMFLERKCIVRISSSLGPKNCLYSRVSG